MSDEETLDLLLDFKDAFDKQPKVGYFAIYMSFSIKDIHVSCMILTWIQMSWMWRLPLILK